MTDSHTLALHTLILTITLNIILGLSGVSFAGKISSKDITGFSAKVIANFGITHEVSSNTKIAPLSGIYRKEAIPNKIKVKKNIIPSKEREIKISNVFTNYSETFKIFSYGL